MIKRKLFEVGFEDAILGKNITADGKFFENYVTPSPLIWDEESYQNPSSFAILFEAYNEISKKWTRKAMTFFSECPAKRIYYIKRGIIAVRNPEALIYSLKKGYCIEDTKAQGYVSPKIREFVRKGAMLHNFYVLLLDEDGEGKDKVKNFSMF